MVALSHIFHVRQNMDTNDAYFATLSVVKNWDLLNETYFLALVMR